MKKKTWISFCFVTIIVIVFFVRNKFDNKKINNEQTNIVQEKEIKKEVEGVSVKKQYPKGDIIKEYKGHRVCAKLEIPIIDLETYILENYSVEALNILPTKFWGANPNEIGNFCVAGHNFINKMMFKNLRKLNISDKIIVSDNKIGKVEYEVFSIDTVYPDNIECLSQETQGKREITLITCTTDSKKRIIVKAREIESSIIEKE